MSDVSMAENHLDRSSVGSCIRILRMKNAMKQVDLARHMSVTSSTISNWENGRRLPSIEELRKIAMLFDVSLEAFSNSVSKKPDHQNGSSVSPNSPQVTLTIKNYALSLTRWDAVFSIIAVIALLLCVVLEGIFRYSFYCFGALSLTMIITMTCFQTIRNNKNKTRTINIAMGGVIQYIHGSDEESINRMKKKIDLLLNIALLTTMVFYTLLYIVFLPLGSTTITAIIIVLGFLHILITYSRKRDSILHLTLCKRIRQYSVRTDLDSLTLHLPLLVEIIMLLIGASLIVFSHQSVSINRLILTIALLSFLISLLISYWFFVQYKKYLQGFKLYLSHDSTQFTPL